MSTTDEMTALKEPRLRRALRHLQRSGRRLVQRRKDWAIIGASNATVFATLGEADVALLAAARLIAPADGGGHVAPSAADELKSEVIPRTGSWLFDVVGYSPRKSTGAGFAGLAIRARAGEGPLTLRQAQAGERLIADAEQSQRADRITMDWSGVAADRKRRRGRDGGLAHAARCARRRLARVRAKLGEGAFSLIWSACVERASISLLARSRGVKGREVHRRLGLVLERLAAAYDCVKAYDEA